MLTHRFLLQRQVFVRSIQLLLAELVLRVLLRRCSKRLLLRRQVCMVLGRSLRLSSLLLLLQTPREHLLLLLQKQW